MARYASFRKDGKVSVWLGVRKPNLQKMEGVDILKDLCGVSYYDLDDQEVAGVDDSFPLAPLERLFSRMSYASSFLDAVIEAAGKKGIISAYWALAQFDFAYNPKKAAGRVARDPMFLGIFDWNDA
jgi:hypothetical protein